ncbi:hypothetical protein [Streptomyces sp. STR69]|uniref:hypothetical protein n=1 Tax=Streptomyces sp. STR69 TaxID=1796942 RepID=UPI0021C9D423|nr:hypothetical protein [Streptomyces sp. STR69]
MAGKVWQPTEAKKFAKWARKGVTVYVVYNMATNLAPYEDDQLFSAYTANWQSPITGSVMFGHLSANALCQNFGPVYEEPPTGMRNIATPPPQVDGPLPEGYEAVLDEAEIRGLDKRVRDGSDPKKRRPLGGWRL